MWQSSVPVALKRLKLEEEAGAIYNEAAILSKLSHPNVVQLFGMFEDVRGYKYMVTEYVSRGSLATVLTKDKSFSAADLLEMYNVYHF